MSKYQKLIKAIADKLSVTPQPLMEASLRTLESTLNGISEYYHYDAIMAAFNVKEEEDA